MLVRVWDASMKLAHTVGPDQVSTPRPGRRVVATPAKSPLAMFVQKQDAQGGPVAYITIDGPGPDDRWLGRLSDYEITRGAKHECAHCQHGHETLVQIGWE
ncbi:hypothetical protein [Nocardia nova]|nr:hypothetical protein [Nocardia nova]